MSVIIIRVRVTRNPRSVPLAGHMSQRRRITARTSSMQAVSRVSPAATPRGQFSFVPHEPDAATRGRSGDRGQETSTQNTSIKTFPPYQDLCKRSSVSVPLATVTAREVVVLGTELSPPSSPISRKAFFLRLATGKFVCHVSSL